MRSSLLIGVLFAVSASACGGRIADLGDAGPGGSPVDTGSLPVHGCSPGPCFDAGPPTPVPIPVPTPVDASLPPPSFDAGPVPPPTFDATVDVIEPPDTAPPPPDLDACVVPPGGQSCSPTTLSCGGIPCPLPGNQCCLLPSGMQACLPAGAKCPGLPQACDEASNCPGGEVCCLVVSMPSLNGVTVSCQPACTGGLFPVQVCRSNTECPGGQCIPQTCSLGGGSLSIEACQLIPTCMPAM